METQGFCSIWLFFFNSFSVETIFNQILTYKTVPTLKGLITAHHQPPPLPQFLCIFGKSDVWFLLGQSPLSDGFNQLRAVLLCKAKGQYLLTCKVSRYCLLALHGCVNVCGLTEMVKRARPRSDRTGLKAWLVFWREPHLVNMTAWLATVIIVTLPRTAVVDTFDHGYSFYYRLERFSVSVLGRFAIK